MGEVNSMAYECPEEHLHVTERNVYLEIIKDGRTVMKRYANYENNR